jgi:hypothetical protein
MTKEHKGTQASLNIGNRLEQAKLLGFKHTRTFNGDASTLKNEMDLMHKKAGAIVEAPANKS